MVMDLERPPDRKGNIEASLEMQVLVNGMRRNSPDGSYRVTDMFLEWNKTVSAF